MNFVRKRLVVWKVALPMVVIDPKKASASTSIVVIFSSLAGFFEHLTLAGMSYPLLGWTAAGAAAGAVLGGAAGHCGMIWNLLWPN